MQSESPMAVHNRLGKEGEKKAEEYLLTRGYVIRDVNWKSGKLELDIVAHKDNTLVFVEVKTRGSRKYEWPEEAVDERKIRNLVDAADAYIHFFNLPFDVRFDVIAIVRESDGCFSIDHIEDAFYPPLYK